VHGARGIREGFEILQSTSPAERSKRSERVPFNLEGEVIFLQRIVSNTEGARRRDESTPDSEIVRVVQALPNFSRYHGVTFCK